MPRETCTNGNGRNGVEPGTSRLTVWTDYGVRVAVIEIQTRDARRYIERHPASGYAERLKIARATARKLEREWQGSGQQSLFTVNA